MIKYYHVQSGKGTMQMTGSDSSADSTPVFRGHHLVCLHFYDGTGFSPEYIRHLTDTVKRAEAGAVKICEGADCICAECPYLENRECSYYEYAEPDIRRMDHKALELLGLDPGESAEWKDLRTKAVKIFSVWYNSCCKECAWRPACEKNEEYRRLSSDVQDSNF
jgi:uncharacterized protein